MAKTRKYPSRIKKRKGNPSLLESRKSKNISENLEIRKNEIPTDNNIDFVTELPSTSNVESSYLENCNQTRSIIFTSTPINSCKLIPKQLFKPSASIENDNITEVCSKKEKIYSENPSDNIININMAVVSAVVNTGQGYTQLEEFAATLNMPMMSNRKYQELHTSVFNYTHKIALEGMIEAGKEEARLAIERGDVDQRGRPKIAVIADGAWSKRSYKTNYNALSGVNSKGETIPGFLRKIVQTRLLRLRYAVTEAIKYNLQQTQTNIPYESKLMILKADIVNGPNHVFGDHANCRRYFCQGPKKGEDNLVDELKRFEMWDDITYARNLLTYHTESLMYNFNNNAAELYNSILAKFIGGKRVNFSQKGSYELRCNAAVTSYNLGANRLSVFNKHVTDKSPGKFTKSYIKTKLGTINKKNRRYCFFKTSKRSVSQTNIGPDENYGNVSHDPLLEMTECEIENYKRIYLDKLSLSEDQVKTLELRTKRQNQCEEWYIERKKRLVFTTINLTYSILALFAKELSPEDAITVSKIKGCLVNNGQLQLNRNNNYFYQVQGQLHISRKMYCYFCVWTPKGLMYEKIQCDHEFWENSMKLKLEHFYLKHLLPSLIKEEILMTN
ncbi:hypothetical protein ACI65C_012044 [Semiaphis heraclei]